MMQAVWALTRPRLALFVALSTATGYRLAGGGMETALWLVSAGTGLLALGASALNQAQEAHLDRRLERTRARPVPSGRLAARDAARIGLAAIAVGLLALLGAGGGSASAAGLLAIVWYNGLYTPLKRRTAFAAIPGALVGSLGPAIGWLAAGGAPGAEALHLLMLVFFLWQVPHFWLLALRYGDDYRRAGLPHPARRLGEPALRRLTFTWIVAAATAPLLAPLFGLLQSRALFLVLCAAGLVLAAGSLRLLRADGVEESWLRLSFIRINAFALAIMALLIADGAIGM